MPGETNAEDVFISLTDELNPDVRVSRWAATNC